MNPPISGGFGKIPSNPHYARGGPSDVPRITSRILAHKKAAPVF